MDFLREIGRRPLNVVLVGIATLLLAVLFLVPVFWPAASAGSSGSGAAATSPEGGASGPAQVDPAGAAAARSALDQHAQTSYAFSGTFRERMVCGCGDYDTHQTVSGVVQQSDIAAWTAISRDSQSRAYVLRGTSYTFASPGEAGSSNASSYWGLAPNSSVRKPSQEVILGASAPIGDPVDGVAAQRVTLRFSEDEAKNAIYDKWGNDVPNSAKRPLEIRAATIDIWISTGPERHVLRQRADIWGIFPAIDDAGTYEARHTYDFTYSRFGETLAIPANADELLASQTPAQEPTMIDPASGEEALEP